MNRIGNCTVRQTDEYLYLDSDKIQFTYDIKRCIYRLCFNNHDLCFNDHDLSCNDHDLSCNDHNITTGEAGFSIRYRGKIYTQKDFSRSAAEIHLKECNDEFGGGVLATVARLWGELKVAQTFRMIPDKSYMLVQCELSSDDYIQSDYMAPMVCSGTVFPLEAAKRPRLLYVPYDNDKWIRYKAQELQECGHSYELSAVYDDETRNGYVIGSVSHDLWKTGIKTHGGFGTLSSFTVFGGVANPDTRDEAMPHGPVRGKFVRSPLIFAGYYEDFRRGLMEYGDANAIICPKLPWNLGVPFGWNSWACVTTGINFEVFEKASETLNQFKDQGFINDNTVYINFDSFWTNLSKDEMKTAIGLAHSRGQKAGIYYTPFACWSDNFDRFVENTGDKYTYRDIIARDSSGNILPPIAGGYPIDPTHPGNLMRVEAMMRYSVEMGFDYLKVDFMSHGACEAVHYLRDITTGIQAYCYGLKHMCSFLEPEVTGRPFFIDFSIAPIFPYQFAHARRISCDVFGQIEDTEYMLNSLTYGFWQNNRIYAFNDPDHTCLYKSVDRPVSDFYEAQSRLNASVIAGTVLLLSDDYRNPEAALRTKKLLNPQLLDIAKTGTTFIPVETATADRASRLFVRDDGNRFYLAVFNYTREEQYIPVPVSRLGNLPEDPVFESLDGSQSYKGNEFLVRLEPAQSLILICWK